MGKSKNIEQHREYVLVDRVRKNLAFDLHDGPAQLLSSAILQIDILENLVASAEAKREVASLKSLLSEALTQLKDSIYLLKPQEISQKGLMKSVQSYSKHFSSSTGIDVGIEAFSKEIHISDFAANHIFRAIQEALQNVKKHSQATHVDIKFDNKMGNLICSIIDNGVGYKLTQGSMYVKNQDSFGISSMRDRIEECNGDFEIRSKPGAGMVINFSVPFDSGFDK